MSKMQYAAAKVKEIGFAMELHVFITIFCSQEVQHNG
jgi:hypothetical protein